MWLRLAVNGWHPCGHFSVLWVEQDFLYIVTYFSPLWVAFQSPVFQTTPYRFMFLIAITSPSSCPGHEKCCLWSLTCQQHISVSSETLHISAWMSTPETNSLVQSPLLSQSVLNSRPSHRSHLGFYQRVRYCTAGPQVSGQEQASGVVLWLHPSFLDVKWEQPRSSQWWREWHGDSQCS